MTQITSRVVRERPILFNGEMVRAIREGRKTQTRRIITPTPDDWIDQLHGNDLRQRAPYDIEHEETGAIVGYGFQSEVEHYKCPYGRPGDRLWVREACSFTIDGYPYCRKPSDVPHDAKVWYRESNDRPTWAETKWHPSIFMPRWASRITLEIANVRIERLTEISDSDAEAEGANTAYGRHPDAFDKHGTPEGLGMHHKLGFQQLWKRINGEDSWSNNPWVWVVEFRLI